MSSSVHARVSTLCPRANGTASPRDRLPCPTRGGWSRSTRHGDLLPVVDADGSEIVLDRPTSLELVGDTAYVVGLGGTIVKIKNL